MSCGKYHSLCITDKYIYSWGTGLAGRLGHGNEQDMLYPKIIEYPFRGKVI